MKRFFYSLLMLCLLSYNASGATCAIDNPAGSGTMDCIGQGGFFGQTFTACESGQWQTLSNINITSLIGTGASFTVYSVEGEVLPNLATRMSHGVFNSAGVIPSIAINRPVTAGGKYTWYIELSSGAGIELCYATSSANFGERNDYVHSDRRGMIGADPGVGSGAVGSAAPAGLGGGAVAGVVAPGGVAFSAGIFFDDTVTEPIPTLSQWGLLIMALLVLNLGLFYVRKKEDILI